MSMQNALDPERMTTEERGREVAHYLALGLARLRMPPTAKADAEGQVYLGFRSRQRVHTPPSTTRQEAP